ncbi:hypothetical protein EOK75_00530 [Pseudorhodobacter turbinis]|uniref:Uncharacterized protein n=1 Tax=Pseudorhodobacter turbinis TaxID=2500533 RepID=A0A4P8ECE0_9RHOB|nr:hypothetical protein [Pseudorhodobacter turbinis]QCO54436.1 hypothetical protein EOK75_00530 [Pseudorhodobacter turbinis]
MASVYGVECLLGFAMVGAGYCFGAAIERAVVDGWGDFSIVLLLVFLGLGFLGWRRLSQTVD